MNMQSKQKGYANTLSRLVAPTVLVLGALGGSQLAVAGISATKHNLSSSSTQVNHAGTEAELCVFCHTPHGGSSASVPLWNKKINTITNTGGSSVTAGYTVYNSSYSSTIDGKVDLSGGVSLACLSCHDGTQAMNSMINAPGSGNWDTTGAQFWAAANVTGTHTTNGALNANYVTDLGQDLSNDHPIGIQYCGGNATSTCKDADFNAISGTSPTWWVPQKDAVAGSTIGSTSNRAKTDIILYARNIGSGSLEPMVECASCHDPHRSDTPTFLRFQNTASSVCLTCHNK